MWNSEQEMQDVPTEEASKVRMALVEPTDGNLIVDSQDSTVENKQVKWWALAAPAFVLIVIAAVQVLDVPDTISAEDEKSEMGSAAAPKSSTQSRRHHHSSSDKGFVSAIAYNENHPLALINNDMVPEGSTIDGVTVIKIRENDVEFERDGERWTQEIGEQPGSQWR